MTLYWTVVGSCSRPNARPDACNGVIECTTQSIQSNMRKTSWKSYEGEVDLFIVYCPQNDTVYVVPAEEVPNRAMYLRVAPPRNKQAKHVRWAKDTNCPPSSIGRALPL